MNFLTKQQFFAIEEGFSFDENSEEEVDWKYQELYSRPQKHDYTSFTFVFQDPSTMKWYQGSYISSYYEGIEDYCFPIKLIEVEPFEIVKTEWKPVKKD